MPKRQNRRKLTSLIMMVPSMASFRSVSVCRTAVITLCIRSISCLKKIFMGDSAPIFCSLAFTWNEKKKKKTEHFQPLYSSTSLYARKSSMKRGPLFSVIDKELKTRIHSETSKWSHSFSLPHVRCSFQEAYRACHQPAAVQQTRGFLLRRPSYPLAEC